MTESPSSEGGPLDGSFIRAVAEAVVERLREERGVGSERLISAAEVARRYALSRDSVYRRADELGAVRIGTGPKARLRFDPVEVERRLTGGEETGPPEPRSRRRGRTAQGNVELLPVRGSRAAKGSAG